MFQVRACELPPGALLAALSATSRIRRLFRHHGSEAAWLLTTLSLRFYTTPLFRLERWILRVFARRPSRDEHIPALLSNQRSTFAAWTLEARETRQLLLCDYLGHTRSWLHCKVEDSGSTRLYFGSAIVAKVHPRTGERQLGLPYRLLLGFHRLYSVLLLSAARRRLNRSNQISDH